MNTHHNFELTKPYTHIVVEGIKENVVDWKFHQFTSTGQYLAFITRYVLGKKRIPGIHFVYHGPMEGYLKMINSDMG